MSARAFIIDRQSGGDGYAIQSCGTLDEALAAQRELEPVPSFPGQPWPHNWRFVIESAYQPNDCRPDLAALTRRRLAEVAELAE